MEPSNKILFKTIVVGILVIATIIFVVDIELLVTVKTWKHGYYSSLDEYFGKSALVQTSEQINVKTTSSEWKTTPGLNQHIWWIKVARGTDFLCNVPLFPKCPEKRIIIQKLEFSWMLHEEYAERIFGFLRPSVTGKYKFAISSTNSSQLWLSSDHKVQNARLISFVGSKIQCTYTDKNNFYQYPSQISTDIELNSAMKYYIEILHYSNHNNSHLTVRWKLPTATNFSTIDKNSLWAYFPRDFNIINVFYDVDIPSVAACSKAAKENPFLSEKHVAYTSHETYANILPTCSFATYHSESLRRERRNLSLSYKFQSLTREYLNPPLVYPSSLIDKVGYDDSTITLPYWPGPRNLKEEDAKEIANLFVESLHRNFNNNISLQAITNIEKSDFLNGSRFLVELDLTTPTNDTIHVSEYIYHDNNTMCYLTPWQRDVTITFVLTAKNQGKWIHIFLDNFASLIQRTQDQNLKAMIFDYESEDIDLPGAIAWRGLEDKVMFLRKKGRYSRRESFNLAVEQIKDPHSIVFLLDLHLTMGEGLLNDIRKHTIEGQLIYTPIIIRQWEETTPEHPYNNYTFYGFYEVHGFGLVGIYKSDWDRVGGFPEPYDGKSTTYKWGGEDYELMDSVCKQGLEYLRVKCPYVYHYYHDKTGMWDDNK